MPAPILTVDIDDEPFRKFKNVFEQHRDAIAKLPGTWANAASAAGVAGAKAAGVAESTGEAAHATTRHVEAADALLLTTHNLNDAWSRLNETVAELDKRLQNLGKPAEALADATHKAAGGAGKLGEGLHEAKRPMDKLKESAKELGHHLKEGTISLLKWSGIGTALAALGGFAGSIYGIDELGLSAVRMGRSAAGLGVTVGEKNAFRLNYQKFVESDQVLSNVAEAKSDYTKRVALMQLGFTNKQINTEDPTQLASEAMQRARTKFINSDRSVQYARATGLLDIFTMADLRRLAHAPVQQVTEARKYFQEDTKRLNLPQDTINKWREFNHILGRASLSIEVDLIRSLSNLAPSLGNLSEGVQNVIHAFLDNPHMKEWLNDLGFELNRFAKYLGSDQVENSIKNFLDDVDKLKTGTEEVIDAITGLGSGIKGSWLYWYFSSDSTKGIIKGLGNNPAARWMQGTIVPEIESKAWPWFKGRMSDAWQELTNTKAQDSITDFEKLGYSKEAAVAITAASLGESGLKVNAVNPTSGAWGLFQLLGDEKRAYKAWAARTGHDPNTTTAEEQRQFIAWRLHTDPKYAPLEAILESPNVMLKDKEFAFNSMYEKFEGSNDPKGEENQRRENIAYNLYARNSMGNLHPVDYAEKVVARLRRDVEPYGVKEAESRAHDAIRLSLGEHATHPNEDNRIVTKAAKNLARSIRRPVHIKMHVENPAGASIAVQGAQVAVQ